MRYRTSARGEPERDVVRVWRRGHLSDGSIHCYLRWVHLFLAYCRKRQLKETDQLTLAGVDEFARDYIGPRVHRLAASTRSVVQRALHAWSCGLEQLGVVLGSWRPTTAPSSLSPLMKEYSSYRRTHNGIGDGTLRRDTNTATAFLDLVRRRGKSVGRITVADIDAFIYALSKEVSKRTVADRCSSLRSFLRFLRVTDRLSHNLGEKLVAPRINPLERPPRALPWSDVRRILRSIPQSANPGKRDFVMLLLMATYGLGSAEVLNLNLDDVDWNRGILRVRRPKTSTSIKLPLLPAVAAALTAYLKTERPPALQMRRIFLRTRMPYRPLTSGAVRHRIRYYARKIGMSTRVIGAHAFRHSHATRQVDAGANLKVISDILGHRRISSTSVYVRVAMKRLRGVALPVPR